MCARELAGFFAAAAAQTSERVLTKARPTVSVLARCSHGIPAVVSPVDFFGGTGTGVCMATNTTVLRGADCSTTVKFSPRGALGLRGVARHYWYAQHVQGVSAGGVAAAVPLVTAAGAAKTP